MHIMSLSATDDWKLTTSPVVRLKRLNETFVQFVCFVNMCANDGSARSELRDQSIALCDR